MKKITPLLIFIFVFPICTFGFEWPQSDEALDKALQNHSQKYARMADAVRQRQEYMIETSTEPPLGVVIGRDKQLVIQLNPALKGARRASILIWEMANAFQRPRFDEIDRRARNGEIDNHIEFGLRMEIIEYDSFRHHREVLEELDKSIGKIDGDYLSFINPALKTLEGYQIPYAHDYIEAQAESGHTRHYETWFYHQIGKTPPF